MGVLFDDRIKSRGEIHFCGISGFNEPLFALGRIYLWSADIRSRPPDAAIICLFDESSVASASSYMALIPPSAVILYPRVISAKLLNFLICSRIPYLILKDREVLSESHIGRIALLDTKKNMLIIDPEIETLNSYPLEQITQKSLVEDLRALPSPMHRIKEESGKGALMELDGANSEIFENLYELAESSFTLPVTLILSIPESDEKKESFRENIEALFCAALYGNFSVMLKGFKSDADMRSALGEMHRVFCRLEENGKEFNGYIKKGIMIDSPIWLMRASPLTKPDFICIELDTLCSNLFGCEARSLENNSTAADTFISVFEQYRSLFAPYCDFWIKCSSLAHSLFFERFLEFTDIKEIYIE